MENQEMTEEKTLKEKIGEKKSELKEKWANFKAEHPYKVFALKIGAIGAATFAIKTAIDRLTASDEDAENDETLYLEDGDYSEIKDDENSTESEETSESSDTTTSNEG